MGDGPRLLKKQGEDPLADQIREAIGAGPDESVEVVTPQFTRTPGMQGPGSPPATKEDWEALRSMSVEALKEMGLQPWNEPDKEGKVLMLFPGEWYPHIPPGSPSTTSSAPWRTIPIRSTLAFGTSRSRSSPG